MKLVFSGFENAIELEPGYPSVIQIENPALFARAAMSLQSGEGRYALEPYSIWDDDVEVKPKDALMLIGDPLSLPWDDKALSMAVFKKVEREFLEDEGLRLEIEKSEQAIRSSLPA